MQENKVTKALATLDALNVKAADVRRKLESVQAEIDAKNAAMGAAVLDDESAAQALQGEITSLETKRGQWVAAQNELNARIVQANEALQRARTEAAAARVLELNAEIETDSRKALASIQDATKAFERLAILQDELYSLKRQNTGTPEATAAAATGFANLAGLLRVNFNLN